MSIHRGKQSEETVPEEAKTLDLLDIDFMSAVLNVPRELKETDKEDQEDDI